MKKFSVLLAFIMIATYSFSQSSYTYNVRKVIDNIYVLEPTISDYRWVTTNIVVIINEQDVLVVDSGLLPSAGGEAIKEIKKLSNKPVRYLVNTHWHGDHWQGNEAFKKAYPEIEFITSTRGGESIARNGMLWATQFYTRYFKGILKNYETQISTGKGDNGKDLSAEELKNMKAVLPEFKADMEEMLVVKPIIPAILFDDHMTLKRGSREIQLHYLGIGNTVGDVVVYLPSEKILIAGDLVVHPSPFESGAFSTEWTVTSKKLKIFSFDYLIPGHGSVQTDSSYLDYLNALFDELIRQMNQAFLNGKVSLDDAKAFVTHQSVVDQLSKNPKYAEYAKKLDPGFVPAAIQTSYTSIKLGKR